MILRKREPKEKWPNFFIVGAPRAGTTSLYRYLQGVPELYMCPVKEPHYFGRNRHGRSKEKYLKLFSGVNDEIAVGEASVGYLHTPETPSRIREAVPDARIIMILRDPVEQVYSHYLEYARKTLHRLSLAEAARMEEHLEAAFYAESVQRYLDTFGVERVKIIIFEEFIRDPRKACGEVLKFLGVDADPTDRVGKAHNSYAAARWSFIAGILQNERARTVWHAMVPAPLRSAVSRLYRKPSARKPPMPEESRKALEQAFREDVRKLEKILGRSLPWFHRKGSPLNYESSH